MPFARWWRHITASHWLTRRKFPSATLDAIEAAIAAAERTHAGQICFAIETALTPRQLYRGLQPRQRAIEVFGTLRVWDTERNNGVLVYVQLADRQVDIVADRGFGARVADLEWESVCRLMEQHFRAGRYRDGALAGIQAIADLLTRHFPVDATDRSLPGNELPDRPRLL